MGAGRWDSDPLHVRPSRQETRQVAVRSELRKNCQKKRALVGEAGTEPVEKRKRL